MAPPERSHIVRPSSSIFLTETFLFTMVVAAAVVSLPFFLSSSWGGQPASKAQETIIQAGEAFAKSAEKLTSAPPTPYLKKLPDLSPYILRALGYTKPLFVDVPYALLRFTVLAIFLPISYVFYALSAVLSPVWVLCEVTFGIFVLVPWRALSWVAGWLFPVYVFCGVAALVGALLGLLGVGIGNVGLYLASSEKAHEVEVEEDYSEVQEKNLKERTGRARGMPTQLGAQRSRNTTPAASIKIEDEPRRVRRVTFVD